MNIGELARSVEQEIIEDEVIP